MFGRVLTTAKGYYPSGYKHMTGTLLSGTSITIPDNIIPLTVLIAGGRASSTSTNTGGQTQVHTNLGQLYMVGSPGGKSVGLPTINYSLLAHCGFDFEVLKTINRVYGYLPPSMGQSGILPTITLIEWLEK